MIQQVDLSKYETNLKDDNDNDGTYFFLQRLLYDSEIYNGEELPSTNNKFLAKYYEKDLARNFLELTSCKELSIVTPIEVFRQTITQNNKLIICMTFCNLDPYQPQLVKDTQKIINVIQLLFSLITLQRRRWNLKLSEKLICQRDGRVYISLLKYSFQSYDGLACLKEFKTIAIKLLPQNLNCSQFMSYQDMVQYLVSQVSDKVELYNFEAPYLGLLKLIIQSDQVMQNSYRTDGNSYIYNLKPIQSLKYMASPQKLRNCLHQIMKIILIHNNNLQQEDEVMKCWAYICMYDQTFIFMDTHDDLTKYLERIRSVKGFTYKIFLKLSYDFAKSLEKISKHVNSHRDLKESNLFVKCNEQNISLIIGDFDRSKPNSTKHNLYVTKDNCMTEGYNPPEVILNKSHTIKSDIWQFGLIIYKIACPEFSIHPWKFFDYALKLPGARDPFENLQSDMKKVDLQGQRIPQEIIVLVEKCLAYREEDRPNIEDIRKILHGFYFGKVKNIKLKQSPIVVK